MTTIQFLDRHFWALWWLVIIVVPHIGPFVINRIVRAAKDKPEEKK